MTWRVRCKNCKSERWEEESHIDSMKLYEWQQQHKLTANHPTAFEWDDL